MFAHLDEEYKKLSDSLPRRGLPQASLQDLVFAKGLSVTSKIVLCLLIAFLRDTDVTDI